MAQKITQSFWQRQKSAIYFGIFVIIIVSLFFYEGSKSGQKTLNLVNFTLELIQKMENQNNRIIEISQKMELKSENYQNLVAEINKSELLGEKIEILWPVSDFAQNTKVFQNMGARLVEKNQQNWQKNIIFELLENQKTVLEEVNYSLLEANLKEKNLQKIEISLISGQKYLESRLERAKKITNLDKQIPIINTLEKKQETLSKINQILKKNIVEKTIKINTSNPDFNNTSNATQTNQQNSDTQATKLTDQNWQEIDQIIIQNPIKIEKSIEIKIEEIQTGEFLENLEQIKKYGENLVKKSN